MHVPWDLPLLILYHYRLTELHGPANPSLLLETWSLPLSLPLRLPIPFKERAWGCYTWQKGCSASWWVGITHKFQWTLLSSCLSHTLWLMLSTNRGGVVFPILSGFLRGWTTRSSSSLASCLPLLLRYMFNLFFFSFFLFALTCNVENCNRTDLLQVSKPIDPLYLPWTIYAYGPDGFI